MLSIVAVVDVGEFMNVCEKELEFWSSDEQMLSQLLPSHPQAREVLKQLAWIEMDNKYSRVVFSKTLLH